MILKSKICGICDSKTLDFIVNHPCAPEFVGFIVNYKKSKRYVNFENLKILTSIDKKKSFFVAVLVRPNEKILEQIKNLNFDYYQLYDCTPTEVGFIKNKYKKKIITAFTVRDYKDLEKHKDYMDVTDIYLFDSKGYEKSLSFDHSLLKNLDLQKDIMIAGNIQIEDNLKNFKEIADIIDISGGLETSGLKDISKIEIFLNNLKYINDKN